MIIYYFWFFFAAGAAAVTGLCAYRLPDIWHRNAYAPALSRLLASVSVLCLGLVWLAIRGIEMYRGGALSLGALIATAFLFPLVLTCTHFAALMLGWVRPIVQKGILMTPTSARPLNKVTASAIAAAVAAIVLALVKNYLWVDMPADLEGPINTLVVALVVGGISGLVGYMTPLAPGEVKLADTEEAAKP